MPKGRASFQHLNSGVGVAVQKAVENLKQGVTVAIDGDDEIIVDLIVNECKKQGITLKKTTSTQYVLVKVVEEAKTK